MKHPLLDEAPAAFVIPEPGYAEGLVERITPACEQALVPFK